MRLRTLSTIGLAGWLFADMLLAFALVVLGTEPASPVRRTPPSATPSRTPAPTKLGLENTWVTVRFTVSPGDVARKRPEAVKAIQKALAKHPGLAGRHAGMVITFGGSDGGVSQGERLAAKVNALLPRSDLDLFDGVTTRNFHSLYQPVGSIELDIYLLAD